MAGEKPACGRCGWPVDHVMRESLGARCMACRAWERTMLERFPTVSNTVREGLVLRKDGFEVELHYPRREPPEYLHVGLMHVRANDGLRLHYDFDRDGWVVEQPWYEDVEDTPPGAKYRSFDQIEHWQETGFFQAWALAHQNITPDDSNEDS